MYHWVRNMGKQIAFGLLYGMGTKLLALLLGETEDEAKKFMDRYFTRFRRAREFIDSVHAACVERAKYPQNRVNRNGVWCGYLKNRWGRRRYLEPRHVYRTVNFLVQSTAADLLRDAIVRLDELLAERRTRMLMVIHDEVIFEVPFDEELEVIPLIVETMETCDKLKCKLKCDVEWSAERWSAKKTLACEVCEGKGSTVELPGVRSDLVQDRVMQALYDNDRGTLEKATRVECFACKGRGYELHDIACFLKEVG